MNASYEAGQTTALPCTPVQNTPVLTAHPPRPCSRAAHLPPLLLPTRPADRCWTLDVKDSEEGETVRMNAVRLNSGHLLPAVGLGVYRSAAGGECYRAVLSALRLGYRHIDSAQIYGNEGDVGRWVGGGWGGRRRITGRGARWQPAALPPPRSPTAGGAVAQPPPLCAPPMQGSGGLGAGA